MAFAEKGFGLGLKAKSTSVGKKGGSLKIKNQTSQSKKQDVTGTNKSNAQLLSFNSPIRPKFRETSTEPCPKEAEDPIETIVCKHCKKAILKSNSKDHIAGCLKSKQEKARKKKEAREAAQRAKERAERADDDDDDDDDIKDGKGRKMANGEDGRSKKRKAEGDDDKDTKKKKKKEEPKPKAPKPKGPVDVERQCGVTLPNGQQCARSLTCKSHSMGAKRAVPGRSLPYDMLLAAYQKKNQARQQKAAIDANAPALFDDDLDNIAGPVDSDEERDAIMMSISRNIARPQPLITRTLYPTKRKYQLVRMKEMLSNALNGNRNGGLFNVASDNPRSAYSTSMVNEVFAPPSASGGLMSAGVGMTQNILRPPSRRESIDVT